ncbi:MAG: DUF1667 domain-containing protein [Lachnospiraceae bacterium]|nr:DUF1667 domain-containing protein [Lachnospiraceae bacterium]
MANQIRELTCIRCPMGCQIQVTLNEEKEVVNITGNTCPRGAEYAAAEVTHPMRTVTSTVKVIGGELPVVSVKTAGDIPKDGIMACMAAINQVQVKAPVHIGDVLLENAAGLGADLVATRDVEAI